MKSVFIFALLIMVVSGKEGHLRGTNSGVLIHLFGTLQSSVAFCLYFAGYFKP